MMHSIQDYTQKINRKLTWLDCISLAITALFLLIFLGFLHVQKAHDQNPVIYESKGEVLGAQISVDNPPFASVNGKTYTFSWCGGSGTIAAKNKIYFKDEPAALASGRTLSKLCQK